jgi:low affinity Fe/Cu permease
MIEDAFELIATRTSAATGSFWAFALASITIVIWAALGPVFHYSETWQLVINTATTIVTFLMVFVIQHAQNKDTRAIQLKLNELIAAIEGASNRLIDIEDLADREVEHLYTRYQRLARSAEKLSPGAKTSVDLDDDYVLVKKPKD